MMENSDSDTFDTLVFDALVSKEVICCLVVLCRPIYPLYLFDIGVTYLCLKIEESRGSLKASDRFRFRSNVSGNVTGCEWPFNYTDYTLCVNVPRPQQEVSFFFFFDSA